MGWIFYVHIYLHSTCPHIPYVSKCFYVYLFKRFLAACTSGYAVWQSQRHVLLSWTLHVAQYTVLSCRRHRLSLLQSILECRTFLCHLSPCDNTTSTTDHSSLRFTSVTSCYAWPPDGTTTTTLCIFVRWIMRIQLSYCLGPIINCRFAQRAVCCAWNTWLCTSQTVCTELYSNWLQPVGSLPLAQNA